MNRIVTTFMIVVVIFASLMFGGMVVMAHGGDVMASATCTGSPCAGAPTHEMGGSACVSHCLRVATNNGSVPTMGAVQLVFLLLTVAVLFFETLRVETEKLLSRSDQWIARLLLQRQLATVIIQD